MNWDASIKSAGLVAFLGWFLSCHHPHKDFHIVDSIDNSVNFTVLKEPVPCDIPILDNNSVISVGINFLRNKEWSKAYDVFSYMDTSLMNSYDGAFVSWAVDWCSFKKFSGTSFDMGDRTLSLVQHLRPPSTGDGDFEHLDMCTVLLESLVDVFPMNYVYHADLGKCYAMREDFIGASSEFVKAVDLWPTDGLGLYERVVKSYIGAGRIHKILEVSSMLECADPTIVSGQILDRVDSVLWSGVSITHDSSNVDVCRDFAILFDALGDRMLYHARAAQALKYYCLSASNRNVLGEDAVSYIREKYNVVNESCNSELKPLHVVFKNSMRDFHVSRSDELCKLLGE
ncbi:hypothetical protein HY483_02415 [Candidatus Woesearchaeota archaeon]|nr:hypothetical protein [Candidatus Woesearchaeota archaeon]